MNCIKISVIIATRHREKILWESVREALVAVKNRNVEIIIVNDGDASLDIPSSIAGELRYYDNPKRGVSSARNLGAEKAFGEVLFFVDDDMWIDIHAINWIENNLHEKSAMNESVYFFNWEYPPALQKLLNQSKIGRYLVASDYHTLWGRLHKQEQKPESGLYQYNSIASCSLVMHKEIFRRAGGYNEKMIFQGEDADFASRLNRLGIPINIVFDVTLQHNHSDRLEMDNFLKRSFDGFGSEFYAVRAGLAMPVEDKSYRGRQRLLFELSRLTEKAWIFIFYLLPNHSMITPVNNKLIGALGGLQRYKQWKKNLQ